MRVHSKRILEFLLTKIFFRDEAWLYFESSVVKPLFRSLNFALMQRFYLLQLKGFEIDHYSNFTAERCISRETLWIIHEFAKTCCSWSFPKNKLHWLAYGYHREKVEIQPQYPLFYIASNPSYKTLVVTIGFVLLACTFFICKVHFWCCERIEMLL